MTIEERLKTMLGDKDFIIASLITKLEEKEKELGECRTQYANNDKPTRK